MRRLHKFMRLSRADRRLLLETAFLVGAVRLGLWLLPFRTVASLLRRMVPAIPRPKDQRQDFIVRASQAVRVTSRMVPKATCLTQALATQVLVSRHGYEARLHIGVAKDGEERLEAHAWVVSNGRVVIGDRVDLSHYTALPPLDIGRL